MTLLKVSFLKVTAACVHCNFNGVVLRWNCNAIWVKIKIDQSICRDIFVNFDISKIFSYMYDWIHTIKQYGSYGCRRVNCKDKKIH